MPYKIVQTLEGKKIKLMTCPSGWEKNNILKYPKKGLFKYVHDENSTPEPDWDVMMCIVKRSNIPSYNDGEKIITDMANRSDTDDAEGNNYPRKRYKSQETLNLNIVADKIVKTRRTQKEPSAINLNNMAETMVRNMGRKILEIWGYGKQRFTWRIFLIFLFHFSTREVGIRPPSNDTVNEVSEARVRVAIG